MSDSGKRTPGARKRAQIYKREPRPVPVRREPQSANEIENALRAFVEPLSLAGRAKFATAFVDRIEQEALEIYRSYNLPTDNALYRVSGGEWFKEPGALETGIQNPLLIGAPRRVPQVTTFVLREGLAEALFGRDHEAAFAGSVLKSVVFLRPLLLRALEEENVLALEMFESAIGLATLRNMHHVEFELGEAIANGLAMKRRAPILAAKSVAVRQAKAEKAWRASAREAMLGYRKIHPHAPQEEVATEVLFQWKSEPIPKHSTLLTFLRHEERNGGVPKRTRRRGA